ncbi:DUF2157 domain-containing protein [Alteromonas macleodii]|uniref:DUF2157 domain-containing protein n=1 Tax=Alteromonas macleodii TaxID=28108 RepID=UPI0020768ABE|nr:DUF2157 domain-containing protein [Alteromonas macleodii]USI26667.1 DUF2157 domain-containing protein [Alteromonas macleodii]
MEVSKASIQKAVANNIISEQQGIALYNFFQEENQHTPSFTFTHILYYLGGLIAIGAMTLFMNLGWEQFGGAGIVFISMLYAGVGLKLANSFARKHLIIPAGICATFVVCLTPLAIYGFQQWLGFWPQDDAVYRQFHTRVKWLWLYMELGTLVTGLTIAWRYKYPFLIMPIAVTLWYISMDAVMLIVDQDNMWNSYTWEFRAQVSMYFGIVMTLLAFWVDIRSRHVADYGFWLYLFGVIAFWGGLTSQNSDSEVSKFFYFCINLVMVGLGALLVRKVFVIFGALGCCFYLGHLASSVFRDSWLFPVALTAIGLGVVYVGIWWQKNEVKITRQARRVLPKLVQELLEGKLR